MQMYDKLSLGRPVAAITLGLTLAAAFPAHEAAAQPPASKAVETRVVNGPGEPVPVTGNVNVSGTPNVGITGAVEIFSSTPLPTVPWTVHPRTPYQSGETLGEMRDPSGSGEICDVRIATPTEGLLVIESIHVSARPQNLAQVIPIVTTNGVTSFLPLGSPANKADGRIVTVAHFAGLRLYADRASEAVIQITFDDVVNGVCSANLSGYLVPPGSPSLAP